MRWPLISDDDDDGDHADPRHREALDLQFPYGSVGCLHSPASLDNNNNRQIQLISLVSWARKRRLGQTSLYSVCLPMKCPVGLARRQRRHQEARKVEY